MKKIFAIALILAMLMPVSIAEAPVNVEVLSDAELKSLYVTVKNELIERKLWDESTLPAGMYEAGKGLPEGTYECVLKNNGRVSIYQNYDNFLSGKIREQLRLEAGQSFTLSLYGSVVYFLEFESIVRPFTGPSW